MKKKILLTGGHLTPAVSLIPELKKKGFKIFFVGRKFAMEQDSSPSEEFIEITKLKIPFYQISTGRLQRRLTLYTLKSLIKIPLGFFKSLKFLKSIKPDVILSFGGYIALPVSLAAKIMGIKIVTHEQTVTIGLANKIISKLSDLILVSHEESLKYFPKDKTVLTGNPLREEIFLDKKINIFPNNYNPVIYITGGNQGSHAINQSVGKNLNNLLKKYSIIHQTGSGVNFKDFKRLYEIKKNLPKELKEKYQVFPYIDSKNIGSVFKKCCLIISRSGANTISEAIALKKPAIFIPLPSSAGDEQFKNAQKLENLGVAKIIDQKNLERDLLNSIDDMIVNIQQFKNNFKNIKEYDKKTPSNIVAEILKILYN